MQEIPFDIAYTLIEGSSAALVKNKVASIITKPRVEARETPVIQLRWHDPEGDVYIQIAHEFNDLVQVNDTSMWIRDLENDLHEIQLLELSILE